MSQNVRPEQSDKMSLIAGAGRMEPGLETRR